jgi:alkanesulfonate monooxygenase SsuD/methylene tetrahydromethanopterin reductase-like flavin-dependent oxidoreductase (luciferase family)
MDVGIGLPNAVRGVDRAGIVEWAQRAEAAGFSSLGTIDRIAYANYESLIALAAAAAVTERIRLVTDILIAPLRTNTALLAKQAATLDHLSGGRLVLGVGLGTPPQAEYATFGEPADRRVHAAKLDEALEVVTGLWSGEPFEHAGAYYTVTGTRFLPPPLQRPRIPIWVACSWPNRRPLTRAARWDGVLAVRELPDGNLGLVTPDDVAALARRPPGG